MVKRLFPQQIKGVDGGYGIRIQDVSDFTKIEVHGFAHNFNSINRKLKSQIGVTLPEEPNQIIKGSGDNPVRALWMAPQKAMLVSRHPIAVDLTSKEALVCDQSYGRVGIRVYGKKAAYVLSKGISVDLREQPQVFQTTLHGISLLVSGDEDGFDIFFYRSFAESFESWFFQSALETGYLRE